MCVVCYQAWKKVNRPHVYAAQQERNRQTRLKKDFGITDEQYKTMLTLQGGVCRICLNPPKKKKLHVDHDHKTGRVRGLLCWKCNFKLLGTWSKPDILLRAYEYVKSDFDGRFV